MKEAQIPKRLLKSELHVKWKRRKRRVQLRGFLRPEIEILDFSMARRIIDMAFIAVDTVVAIRLLFRRTGSVRVKGIAWQMQHCSWPL